MTKKEFEAFKESWTECSTSWEQGSEGPVATDRGSFKVGWSSALTWTKKVIQPEWFNIAKDAVDEVQRLQGIITKYQNQIGTLLNENDRFRLDIIALKERIIELENTYE